MNIVVEIWHFALPTRSVATLNRWCGQIYNRLVYNFLRMLIIKNHKNRMVFDVTLTSQPSWKLILTFVQLQNSYLKLKFPSFRCMLSKYSMKYQSHRQLYVEQTSKIWCKKYSRISEKLWFFVLGRFILTHPVYAVWMAPDSHTESFTIIM